MSKLSTSNLAVYVFVATTLAACGGGSTAPDNGAGGEDVADEPGIALRSLAYTDSGNWQYKVLMQTVADASPDSNGITARTVQYARSTNGSPQTWGFDADPDAADDLYWSGAQWRTCPTEYRTTLGEPANGTRLFNFCDLYATGSESVIRTDVSAQTMRSVMTDIQRLPGSDGFTAFADYGPQDLAVLGAVTFPEGSQRQDVVSTVDAYAPRYSTSAESLVRVYNANIAAGGDRRNGGTAPCRPDDNAQLNEISYLASNLQQIIGAARGTPCVFDQIASGNSLDPHEWWGPSTVEFGEAVQSSTLPEGTGTYYSDKQSLRIAFTGTSQVSFYQCWVRRSDGSVRNCTEVGVGAYVIETLGDARVLNFINEPAVFRTLPYERVLIERNSRVAAGMRERPGVRDAVGFNDIASQALLRQLLIPVPVPQ